MRQLHFDLLRLLEDDRQGSHGARRGRRYVLVQAAETLHRLGYRGLRARGSKGRHVDAAGLDRMHGLRRTYALHRYEALTGWKAPGGPASGTFAGARQRIDRAARLTVAAELGHSRREIARTYLGA